MIRFTDGTIKILNDTELFDEFKRRGIDPYWSTLNSIQTAVKSKIGNGKPINFTFKSPCYKRDKNGKVT